MNFNFKIDPSLLEGAERLSALLGFGIGEGIEVVGVQGERRGVSLKDGKATIYYDKKFYFFRALGLLAENLKKGDSFDITEDGFFKDLGVMIDTSRCGVPTVKTQKNMLDYLAIMGYSNVQIYIEDTFELPSRPYFGYMRGRYTRDELREIDDYADGYGIEIIPCIECYAHMEKYLMWPEAGPIRDTASVLLAREEATFEFVEELISTISSCVRSKRIHIGMDEAWDMGLGAFLDKHGYVPPFDIFNEYMERLIAITDKYGLKPMMWSDMYFRIASGEKAFYEESTVIPEEVKA